jgi:hypothetical protein
MSHRVLQGSGQNVAFAIAGGASAQSTAFGTQTRRIRVCVVGVYAADAGARIEIGDNPVASATTTLLPVNEPEYFTVSPGQKVAVLSNNATAGTLNVVELTD